MTDIRELIPVDQRDHAVVQGMWYAKIVAPVPVLETDYMYVVIPDIDNDVVWGPCRWQPRSKKSLVNVAEGVEAAHNINLMIPDPPAAGREALVMFDNRQHPWVVTWW